jgi:hypothetical protein
LYFDLSTNQSISCQWKIVLLFHKFSFICVSFLFITQHK